MIWLTAFALFLITPIGRKLVVNTFNKSKTFLLWSLNNGLAFLAVAVIIKLGMRDKK